MKNSFAWSCVIRLKRCSGLARDKVCPEEQGTVGLMKWTVVPSGRECWYPTHQSSLLDKPFTQPCDDVIQSQHALPVPEDTSPAVLGKAVVNTHLHVHGLVQGIHVLTCAHKHALTQSHSCKNTPKHTHCPAHKHTSNVSKSPERLALLVCKLPAFQGKTWPFTSILVFACTNCQAVQTLPGR